MQRKLNWRPPMQCPKCGGSLRPWPWEDGGYKGVRCESCDGKWWSHEFSDAAFTAEKNAVTVLIASLPFPKDAMTEEEWSKRVDENFDDDEEEDEEYDDEEYDDEEDEEEDTDNER
jgi:hypothetical protein